jgi:hypothetical protein
MLRVARSIATADRYRRQCIQAAAHCSLLAGVSSRLVGFHN